MHFLFADLICSIASDDFTRLNIQNAQNILKHDDLIIVEIEETPGVHQVKE